MSGSSNDQNGAGAASSNGDAAAAASYRQIISSARQIGDGIWASFRADHRDEK